ncbi:MAG: carbohydrate porin, partial [Candidatus Sulfotelmatobacter sp.]
ADRPRNARHKLMEIFEGKSVRTFLLLFFLAPSLSAFGKSGSVSTLSAAQNAQVSQRESSTSFKQEPDDLKQELDVDALALSKIPADPIFQRDPLAPIFQPIDKLVDKIAQLERLKFGATYTFLNQYATITPEGVRHNQPSGRLDFTGAWVAYDDGSTAGSISLLVRSGSNIGISQQFNLSDRLGSGLYLNCLEGGGPQEPITLNILDWRQDVLEKRLSFYVGKIHPNEYISLSMFNNDERTQFLNRENDGNLAFASEGTYAGGAAVEFQATRHVYLHALAVDTEGAQQSGIETLVDRKYMEAAEVGWFSGSPGEQYRDYRVGMWLTTRRPLGGDMAAALPSSMSFPMAGRPLGDVASRATVAPLSTDSIGLAQVHPFERRGDMFGIAFNYTEPTHTGKHHESVFESFYRLRLTRSMDLGPDMEVSIHPTYASRAYTTTLVSMRMRIIF